MWFAVQVSRAKRRRGTAPSRRAHLHKAGAVFGVALAGIAGFLVYISFGANAQSGDMLVIRENSAQALASSYVQVGDVVQVDDRRR